MIRLPAPGAWHENVGTNTQCDDSNTHCDHSDTHCDRVQLMKRDMRYHYTDMNDSIEWMNAVTKGDHIDTRCDRIENVYTWINCNQKAEIQNVIVMRSHRWIFLNWVNFTSFFPSVLFFSARHPQWLDSMTSTILANLFFACAFCLDSSGTWISCE